VYDEQRKKYGRTRQAITETIRICKDRNVLKEYLESREQEVVTIMMSLYDEEEIMKSYIRSERYEERQIATQEKAIKTANKLIRKKKMSLEDIADATDLTIEEVKKLEQEIMQLS
jgi:predicted transposase YdaD